MTTERASSARPSRSLRRLAGVAGLAFLAGCARPPADQRWLERLSRAADPDAPTEAVVATAPPRTVPLDRRWRVRLRTSDREAVATLSGVAWEVPIGPERASLQVSVGAVGTPEDPRRELGRVLLVSPSGDEVLAKVRLRPREGWHDLQLEVPEGPGARRLRLESAGPIPVVWSELYREGDGAPDRPNLVFVIVDTLRPDHLSLTGYRRRTSPHLDRFAAGALVFRHAYSASTWTLPSTASLMTGLYPDQHGVIRMKDVLPAAAQTIAERLRRLGYRTAAFTDGGFVDPQWGFAQGFDRYDSTRGPAWVAKDVRKVVEPATAWIAENRFAPYFLFIHTYEVHQPYMNPEGDADPFLPGEPRAHGMALRFPGRLDDRTLARAQALYDGEIRRADRYLDRIWQALERVPGQAGTAILLTADHGEEFQEHGDLDHGLGKVFEENVRVPLVLRLPHNGKAQGVRSGPLDTPVSGVDVAPTLLDLAGAPADEIAALPGTSLVALAKAPPQLAREILVEGSNSFHQLAERRYRLDRGATTLVLDPKRHRARLFDRRADPGMLRPRRASGADGEIVATLQTTLAWLGAPYAARLPDDAAGLAIPHASSVTPLVVWDGLERRVPPRPGSRLALQPGRPHAIAFALRPGSGEPTLRLDRGDGARPDVVRLSLAEAPSRRPPFRGPLPTLREVVAGLGLGSAGEAELDEEGIAELRALGYLR